MKDYELTITKFLRWAVDLFGHKEIVSKLSDGSIHRYTYADAYGRICRLAHALDEYGYLDIVDRIDDAIKSGGEWISSVELENALIDAEGVAEAAVISVPHDKWQERPVAFVVVDDPDLDEAALREYLLETFPKWWLPDVFRFVDEIPKTTTQKFNKKHLRERFLEAEGELPLED